MKKMSLKVVAISILVVAGICLCKDTPEQAGVDRVYELHSFQSFKDQLTKKAAQITNLDKSVLVDDFIIQDTSNDLLIYNISVDNSEIKNVQISDPSLSCEINYTADLYATYSASTKFNAATEGQLLYTVKIPGLIIKRTYDSSISDYNYETVIDKDTIVVPSEKGYFPKYTGNNSEEVVTLLIPNLSIFSSKTADSFMSNVLSTIPIYLNQRNEINIKSGSYFNAHSRKINLVRNKNESCQAGYRRTYYGAYINDNYKLLNANEVILKREFSENQLFIHNSLLEELLITRIQEGINFTLANNNPVLPLQTGYFVRSLSIVYPLISRFYSPNHPLSIECNVTKIKYDKSVNLFELSCDFVFDQWVHLNFIVTTSFSIKSQVEKNTVKFYLSNVQTIDILLDKDLGGISYIDQLAVVIDKLFKDYFDKQALNDFLVAELDFEQAIKVTDFPNLSGVIISNA